MATGTIVINDDLRTMQIPSTISLLGVESDDDVNIINFQMPKMYSGFDLSEFSARINYMNANGEGDLYIADDMAVDGDNLTFSWLVGRNACKYVGSTQFIVCLKKFDDEQVVVKEFNTTVYSLPVLKGLETTEAVVQQNPDIIEYILTLIEDAGGIDMSNYYTKAQVDALIPSRLPNPASLYINGVQYDGSQAVSVFTEQNDGIDASASGQIIHVDDVAVGVPIKSLNAYDSNFDELAPPYMIAVSNKNLIRLDQLPDSRTVGGVTFTKNNDGAIIVNGTNDTDEPAGISYAADPHIFEVEKFYTLNANKDYGYANLSAVIRYYDNSTSDYYSEYAPATWQQRINKTIDQVTISIFVPPNTTVDNEYIYPQLEIGRNATEYVPSNYGQMYFVGNNYPEFLDEIGNIWSPNSNVKTITIDYTASDAELDIYDLIIESDANFNWSTAQVSNFHIMKGNILDVEEMIANGKIPNAICILHEDWSSVGSWANYRNVVTYLPLCYWNSPYHFFSFGKVSVNGTNSTTFSMQSVVMVYDIDDGYITNVAIKQKGVSI